MCAGVPRGCTDIVFTEDGPIKSDLEEDWRVNGNTIADYGFELTQDKDNQQVTKAISMSYLQATQNRGWYRQRRG